MLLSEISLHLCLWLDNFLQVVSFIYTKLTVKNGPKNRIKTLLLSYLNIYQCISKDDKIIKKINSMTTSSHHQYNPSESRIKVTDPTISSFSEKLKLTDIILFVLK